jgi:DNA-binding CsgD family transcriptional regulator
MAPSELSPTEVKILELAADGLYYNEMSAEVGHPHQVIKNLSRKMFIKMGADNITQAVAMAIRRKIIT